jgi:hypothetical protein
MTAVTSQAVTFSVYDGATFPSWYPAIGACVAIPTGGTTIGTAVRAAGGNSYGGTDPDDIVEPWSGGALVYISGQPYLVVYGGGHGDSGFNGLMKFGPLHGIGSDSPTWTTFLAPSSTSDQRDASTYLDGRQSSIHSYNGLVGVNDRMYSMQTSAYYSIGHASNAGYYFTPSGQTTIASNVTTGAYGCAAYHDGKIYYIGGNSQFDRLRIYTIASNSWSSESSSDIAFANYIAAAVDTSRGKLLVIGGATLQSGAYWDLSTLSRQTSITRPSTSAYALEYDVGRDVFVAYVSGSLTVYETSAATLASGGGASWASRTFTGSTPTSSPVQGTYGRFRYVPELNGYMVVPDLETAVYFMRSS